MRREQELITSRAATTQIWLQHVPMESNSYYSKKFTGTTLLCFSRTTIPGRKECAIPCCGHLENQRSGLDGYRSTYGKNQWRTPWTICRHQYVFAPTLGRHGRYGWRGSGRYDVVGGIACMCRFYIFDPHSMNIPTLLSCLIAIVFENSPHSHNSVCSPTSKLIYNTYLKSRIF